jgi:hypothetical protein
MLKLTNDHYHIYVGQERNFPHKADDDLKSIHEIVEAGKVV